MLVRLGGEDNYFRETYVGVIAAARKTTLKIIVFIRAENSCVFDCLLFLYRLYSSFTRCSDLASFFYLVSAVCFYAKVLCSCQ